MSYSTLNSSDDLQREQMERKWHFIGRAYVCRKGGFQHQHVNEDDFRSCNGDDMKTKRDQEHEKYLKDKDLRIAAEKTKEVETRARAERDLEEQRRQTEIDLIEQRRQAEIDLVEQRRQAEREQVEQRRQAEREQVEQRRQAEQDDRDKELQDRREQCEREDMKTKRDQEHEKYLKDKDLEIATEKSKTEETRAKAERDLEEQRRKAKQDERDKELQDRREQCERDDIKTKRDQEHEKYLKDKDLKIAAEKRKMVETRAKAESDLLEQRRQAKQEENDTIFKIKEKELQVMEQQAKSARLEERKIKVEEIKANNLKDLLAFSNKNNRSTNHGSTFNSGSVISRLRIDIGRTGSMNVRTDNDEVPSAINRNRFN